LVYLKENIKDARYHERQIYQGCSDLLFIKF